MNEVLSSLKRTVASLRVSDANSHASSDNRNGHKKIGDQKKTMLAASTLRTASRRAVTLTGRQAARTYAKQATASSSNFQPLLAAAAGLTVAGVAWSVQSQQKVRPFAVSKRL